MAELQTHVFDGNEWTTQTVRADQLIGRNSGPRGQGVEPPPPEVPPYGVLTRTIIESPIIRWVLPVQLRSSRFNDVALVGDQSVQICELSEDNQLLPIAKKLRLGSTIRNCRVMGTHDYLRKRREDIHANYHGNLDTEMPDSSAQSDSLPRDVELFQQILMLVLNSGELVFVYMEKIPLGGWDFVSENFPISSGRLVDPGFHMAISPDWSYLALGCSEDYLVVYQLASISELRLQHNRGERIQPIQSVKARSMQGVLHKLEFLHPRSNDGSQTILLIIIVQSGVPRLSIFEWGNSDYQSALAVEKKGYRLERAAGLPLLVIPLTVCSQFLMITENSMGVYSDVLSGPPTCTPFELGERPKTKWHYSLAPPMWVAWTRPLREESYHTGTDLIYLAREDGWVNCLEITGDSGIEGSIYMGPLRCNIDTAFASLSTPQGEILVAGGDNGPGALWSVQARQNPERIGPLPNWSPSLDIVLTGAPRKARSDRTSWTETSRNQTTPGHMVAPERIFTYSGRDVLGAIIELRYGIEAKIGLDLSYSAPIKRCWAIPNIDDDSPEAGFFILLALPETSALLQISHDLSEVSERGQETVAFDLLSTTLVMDISQDKVIQVTTTHATIVSPVGCYSYLISDMMGSLLTTVTDAALLDGILALSVYSPSGFEIVMFTLDGTKFILKDMFNITGEVNALSIVALSTGTCILAGVSRSDSPSLVIYSTDSVKPDTEMQEGRERAQMEINLTAVHAVDSAETNAVTSMICLGDDTITVGMRNGEVLTIPLTSTSQPGLELSQIRTNHFGASASHVSAGMMIDIDASIFVCNDAGLAIMTEPNAEEEPGCLEEIYRVWLTDVNEAHLPSPTVDFVTRPLALPSFNDATFMMISGSRVLITELRPRPAPVPRYMPIGATPLALLYSARLDALVTMVLRNGSPKLRFYDANTGDDLSRPVTRMRDFGDERYDDDPSVAYLNIPRGSKFVSLLKWTYKDKGNTYEWFVVLIQVEKNVGRLLIVSAEQETHVTASSTSRRIRFWSQFNRRIGGVPRCAVTDDQGIFVCFGKKIEYTVIENKKFKTRTTYQLPSPASSLRVVDGQLHALTSHHSLIVLDYSPINSHEMVQLHTDEVARHGLHSIDVGSVMGSKDQLRLSLVSDPMCSVYGLWVPSKGISATSLQLIFRVHLGVSIRRFVTGHTRPRWTRDGPRCTHVQDSPDRQDILGLAIDGSVTQFTIIHEPVWKVLRFIQNLAMTSEEICVVPRDNDGSATDPELDPRQLAKTEMHIDGDILYRCLELRLLKVIVEEQQQRERLEELVKALVSEEATRGGLDVYAAAYIILHYYLSPAL